MRRRYKYLMSMLMRTQKVDCPVDQRSTLGFMRMGMRCGRTFPSRAVQSHCNSYSISHSPPLCIPFRMVRFFNGQDLCTIPSHLEQSSSYSNSISHSTLFPFSFWKVRFTDLLDLCMSPSHWSSPVLLPIIFPFPPPHFYSPFGMSAFVILTIYICPCPI